MTSGHEEQKDRAAGHELIAPGVYKARALCGEIGQHERTRNDQAVVVLEILEGVYQGKTIRWYATVTEKTQRFVIPGLVLCGWRGGLDDDGRGMTGITDNEVDVEIVHEEYQGRTIAKVRGIIDPNVTLAGKALSPEQRESFLSRWGEAIASAVATQETSGGRANGGAPF